MKLEARSALVLYASETGNAQEGAEEIGRMVTRLRFQTRTCAFDDDIDIGSLISHKLCICVVATTGQGDFPANARAFWKSLLRKKLRKDCLSETNFAIFGLGDSSYPKYNWAALKLRKRITQLGGHELLLMGQGDDQNAEGHESTFFPWLSELRNRLSLTYSLPLGIEPLPDDVLLQPRQLLSLDTSVDQRPDQGLALEAGTVYSNKHENANGESHNSNQSSNARLLDVCLEENERLTSTSHWQDVRLLTFSTPVHADYLPGDILAIHPRNAAEDINLLIELMGWEAVADKLMTFSPNPCSTFNHPAEPHPLNEPAFYGPKTLREMLADYVDLNAIPRRYFFHLLSHFTTDEFQKERLIEFTQLQNLDELYDYTTRPRRSILEVLQEFHNVRIPWPWAMAVLPRLRSRQFSIASGGRLSRDEGTGTRFQLLVAIVKYRTVIRKVRRGVCTRYLESLEPGRHIRVLLQKGGLNITRADVARPILMVGPGTGVAPIRSLIWQRHAWNQETDIANGASDGASVANYVGKNVLFFGCRNADADYFFQDEWTDLQANLSLQIIPAFSRDQKGKAYVQDLIRRHSQLVCDMIYRQNAIVFVCGSSGKMPQAVRDALISALEREVPLERTAAELCIASMEKQDRYKQETW